MPTRKILVTLLLLVFIFSFFASGTKASAKDDYSLAFSRYRDAQENYKKAKDTYNTFKTLEAKSSSFTTGKEYLGEIDLVLLAYYFYLLDYENSLNWHDKNDIKNKSEKIINDEKVYLVQFQKRIDVTKTLEEIAPLAQELEKHQGDETQNKLNVAIASFVYISSYDNFSRFGDIASDLIGKAQIKTASSSAIVNNWQSEIESIKKSSHNSLAEAQKIIDQGGSKLYDGDLKKVIGFTGKIGLEMRRSIDLFREILKYL